MQRFTKQLLRTAEAAALPLVTLLALMYCFSVPAYAQGGDSAAQDYVERIISFHSDITVNADSSMLVKETIVCNVQGNQIQRGIIRDFPTRYTSQLGINYNVGFEVLSVSRDGQPEPFKVERRSNGRSVRIGNADYFLPTGQHTYEITYTTNRQLGFFENHDELYWNVTGNGWTFSIDRASAFVSLPENVDAAQLKLSAYRGPMGSTQTDFITSEAIGKRQAYFETTRPLSIGEGLTIVVEFPKGMIAAPTQAQQARWFISNNKMTMVGLAGMLLVLSYYFLSWLAVGIDPRRGMRVQATSAPEELSPSMLGYIRRMMADYTLMSAAIISLGDKGALRVLAGDSSGYVLQRESTEPRLPLSSEETALLTALLPHPGATLEIERSNHARISGGMTAFNNALSRQCEGVYFRRNMRQGCVGCAFAVLVPVIMAFVGGSFESLLTAPGIGIIVSLILIAVLFGNLLPAYTRRGRTVLDGIEGFRDALSGNGPYRETLRENFLPYAVALGVEREWSRLFDEALRQENRYYQPVWYYGDRFQRFDNERLNVSSLISDFSSDFSSTISSSSSAPGSSSGGGGGGSSGGGGGGGGGSGW